MLESEKPARVASIFRLITVTCISIIYTNPRADAIFAGKRHRTTLSTEFGFCFEYFHFNSDFSPGILFLSFSKCIFTPCVCIARENCKNIMCFACLIIVVCWTWLYFLIFNSSSKITSRTTYQMFIRYFCCE